MKRELTFSDESGGVRLSYRCFCFLAHGSVIPDTQLFPFTAHISITLYLLF